MLGHISLEPVVNIVRLPLISCGVEGLFFTALRERQSTRGRRSDREMNLAINKTTATKLTFDKDGGCYVALAKGEGTKDWGVTYPSHQFCSSNHSQHCHSKMS